MVDTLRRSPALSIVATPPRSSPAPSVHSYDDSLETSPALSIKATPLGSSPAPSHSFLWLFPFACSALPKPRPHVHPTPLSPASSVPTPHPFIPMVEPSHPPPYASPAPSHRPRPLHLFLWWTHSGQAPPYRLRPRPLKLHPLPQAPPPQLIPMVDTLWTSPAISIKATPLGSSPASSHSFLSLSFSLCTPRTAQAPPPH